MSVLEKKSHYSNVSLPIMTDKQERLVMENLRDISVDMNSSFDGYEFSYDGLVIRMKEKEENEGIYNVIVIEHHSRGQRIKLASGEGTHVIIFISGVEGPTQLFDLINETWLTCRLISRIRKEIESPISPSHVGL